MEHVRYSDLKTKVSKKALLKEKLNKDDRWIARGLLTVYEHQTLAERQAQKVEEHNGVGFTGIDGEILSSFAERLLRNGARTAAYDLEKQFHLSTYLTPSQEATLRNKMPKYAQQLLKIAEQKKTPN
jgi:hypothetical protein